MSLATTRTLPSVVRRDDSFERNRSRCSSLSARDSRIFQKISTREDVLLTCCPPAPDDLETRTSSSLRGIERESLTATRFPGAVTDWSLTRSAPAANLQRDEERNHSQYQDHQHLRGDGGE